MFKHAKEFSVRHIWMHILILCLIVGFCLFNRNSYRLIPFSDTYTFDSPSNVTGRRQGGAYVIDGAKKKIIILNEKMQYSREIQGGSLDKAFYYASLLCDDAEGNIYLADVVYSGKGTRISKERILKFDSKGNYETTLFEVEYSDEEAPYQYGNIVELYEDNGVLHFSLHTDGEIRQYEMNTDGTNLQETIWMADLDISDIAYDSVHDQMVVCTRQCDIVTVSRDGSIADVWRGQGGEIPWTVTVEDGTIYYTELISGSIYSITNGGRQMLTSSDSSYYTMERSADGTLFSTDYAGIWYWQNGEETYLAQVGIQNRAYRMLVWIVGLAGILYAVWIISAIVRYCFGRIQNREQLIRIAMVLIASVLCSVTIFAMMLNTMTGQQGDADMQELRLFADLLEEQLDVEGLMQIQSLRDYKNDLYNAVKQPLDHMIDISYEQGSYYYYMIYTGDGTYVNGVMDYEETQTTRCPAYEWGDNIYTQTLTEGIASEVEEDTSAYGTWSFVILPIRDTDGNVVAALEVGMNVDDRKQQQKAMIQEVLVTTGISVIVIIMLLMEFIFLITAWSNAKKNPENPAEFVPLRTMIFLIYLADALQDAFIVQLCYRLYDNSLPIPEGLAYSLPISAELFMAALFSLLAGRFVAHVGTKKNMLVGAALTLIGFLMCGIWGSYTMILIGKCLIGMGMGVIYVTANTLAALGRNEEERGRAFAGVSAGVLSGITVGDGLGSIILTFGSYKVAYLAGAVCMLGGLLILLQCKDMKPKVEREESSIGFAKFMFNPRVLPFLILILLPFMILLSYREYFFPLYAEDNGMSEVSIGRLFLICGLIVIYVGPVLGEWLIQKMGSRRAMLLASILMVANIGIYMCYPSFVSAVAGVIILSVIISFAYTCQYAYFASIPECDRYGEGNAMGVYSMIENIGQTLGPIVFGFAISLGYVGGIRLVGAVAGGITLLYILIAITQRRKNG